MNWEAIGAIGEMIAAGGVIFSLVYLAVQIKHQGKESRLAAVNVLAAQWADLLTTFGESTDSCAIWLRGLQSFDDLDSAEKVRFGSFLGRLLRNSEGLYLHYLDGVLDPRVWRGTERTLADMVAYPGAQAWWATRRHWHTDEFVELVEKYTGNEPTLYGQYIEADS